MPKSDLVGDGLVTIPEAMAFLSVSRSYLYQLLREEQIPSIQLGRSRRIPKRALIDYAAKKLDRKD